MVFTFYKQDLDNLLVGIRSVFISPYLCYLCFGPGAF